MWVWKTNDVVIFEPIGIDPAHYTKEEQVVTRVEDVVDHTLSKILINEFMF